MGIVHEGGILTIDNFSGNDDEARQKIIDTFVSIKALALVPLTESEKEALAELQAAQDAEEAEAQEAAKFKEEKKAAFLAADFAEMNKQPMIDFAAKWEVELQGDKVDEIRSELITIQMAYEEQETSPE